MKRRYLFSNILLLFFLCGCDNLQQKLEIVNLRTEYSHEPIGIGVQNPRFTWEYAGKADGSAISLYEINIGTHPDSLFPYSENMKLAPHTRYYWKVTVWYEQDMKKAVSDLATFETAKLTSEDWTGKWITDTHDKEFEPAPMFRKTFRVDKNLKFARLYIASAGYHEAFLNGMRVGEDYLNPGYTHFDKRILYVTHDVTTLLKQGENTLSAVLGNGWYNVQSVAVWNFHQAKWRNRPSMLAELRLVYEEGRTEVVTTDTTWRTSTGPYLYNNIYSGDIYDARLEEDGWKENGFDDRKWENVQLVEAPASLCVTQHMPAIQVTEEIKPLFMHKLDERTYVYAFPKNMSGFCRLKIKGRRGTRITLSYGELLKKDGHLEQGNINVYYHPEKPEEKFQTDVYILKGNGMEEVFVPSFTYHGFQYVKVTSSEDICLTPDNLTALFLHTNLEATGNFSCSSNLFNKIWDATMQSYRSNIHSIPTDCPQREKNGWTADAYIAIDLGLLGFDGITFYEKWMDDFVDNQRAGGDISGIIPSSGWGYGEWPGPVWDAALFIIPDALYRYYGDQTCIKKMYPVMQRYMEYLKTTEQDGMLHSGLGDWVFWKSTTNNEYTSTAFYYLDYSLMEKFADLLGQDASPYRRKAEELKKLINQKFYDPTTGLYAEGTQTAQALALYLGFVEKGEHEKVAAQLHQRVAANNYFLDFGLLGSKTVLPMLVKYGYISDAMKMVCQTEAPSWGYWVETMGYSTLPETWTLSPEFKDASLNHVFMGDVSAWMMQTLAGINVNTASPGFQKFVLTPHFVKELDWVKGEYRSVHGTIACEWERKGKQIVCTVRIPIGVHAELLVDGVSRTVEAGVNEYIYNE